MNSTLLAALLGVITGTLSYWFTTFWMKPLLRYRSLRGEIFADLIFYAQVVNADGLSERMKSLYEDRVVSNRRHSAELAASLLELPAWYLVWLRWRGHRPEAAVSQLIGFSNTTAYNEAGKRVECIKAALGIRSELV